MERKIRAQITATATMEEVALSARWQKFEPLLIKLLARYSHAPGSNLDVAMGRIKIVAGLVRRLTQMKHHSRKDLTSMRNGVRSWLQKTSKYVKFFDEYALSDWDSLSGDDLDIDVHLQIASYHANKVFDRINEILNLTKTKNPSSRPPDEFGNNAIVLSGWALLIPFFSVYASHYSIRRDELRMKDGPTMSGLSCPPRQEDFSIFVANFVWAVSDRKIQVKRVHSLLYKNPELKELLEQNEFEPWMHKVFDLKNRLESKKL